MAKEVNQLVAVFTFAGIVLGVVVAGEARRMQAYKDCMASPKTCQVAVMGMKR